MKLSNLKKIIITGTLLSISAIALVASANHPWGSYHWARTSNPFILKLGDNVSSVWDSYLGVTSSDWSQSSVFDTTVVAGQSKGNCRPTSGRVEVCNKAYGNTGWLGLAQIWVNGSHITQAVAKMNDTYFNLPPYNTAAWRQFVICQEVGHNFGLAHQDENFYNANLGSCMDYTNDPDGSVYSQLSNLNPNQHDYDQLVTIYSHFDSTTTVKNTTTSKGNSAVADLENPSDWGKEIKKDARGRSSLFEKDLGGGNKVFTFIIWVR